MRVERLLHNIQIATKVEDSRRGVVFDGPAGLVASVLDVRSDGGNNDVQENKNMRWRLKHKDPSRQAQYDYFDKSIVDKSADK